MDHPTNATKLDAQQATPSGLLDEVMRSSPVQWASENRYALGAVAVGALLLGGAGATLRSMAKDLSEFKAARNLELPVTNGSLSAFGDLHLTSEASGEMLGRSAFAHEPTFASLSLGSKPFGFHFHADDNFHFAPSTPSLESHIGTHYAGFGHAPLHELHEAEPGQMGDYDAMIDAVRGALVDDGGMNFHYGLAAHDAMPDLEPMRGNVTKASWDAALGLDTSHWDRVIAKGAAEVDPNATWGVTKERRKLLDLMAERQTPEETVGIRYTGMPLPTEFDQMEHMRKGETIPSLPISRADITHAVVTNDINGQFGAGIWSYHNNAFGARHNARLTGGKVEDIHYVGGSPQVNSGTRRRMNISMGLPLDHAVKDVRIVRETPDAVPLNKIPPESI